MSAAVEMALAVGACVSGAACAGCIGYGRARRAMRFRLRDAALETQGAKSRVQGRRDLKAFPVRYAETLTRKLYTGATKPITPSVRAKRAGKTRAGARYLKDSLAAGCKKTISVSAYCETRTRFALVGMLAGALFGVIFSTELAVLLACAGGFAGSMMLPRAVKDLRNRRKACAERHLSEMLEVVALGLRSGLTFDRSFALYGSHFGNEFANECARAYRKWSLGLSTREEALRELSGSFDCAQLSRVVDNVLRGLRFGSSITDSLEEAAQQSRAAYRTALEERVAKAPVKMMLPTGTLILPAMLLLVMGPILLELAGGF